MSMSILVPLAVFNLVGISAYFIAREVTRPFVRKLGALWQQVIWLVAAITCCFLLRDHVVAQLDVWRRPLANRYSQIRQPMTVGTVAAVLGDPEYWLDRGEKNGRRQYDWFYGATNVRKDRSDGKTESLVGDAEFRISFSGEQVSTWSGDVKDTRMTRYRKPPRT